jgi:anaerobic sulfite reductase subunit A
MGFRVSEEMLNEFFAKLALNDQIFAPKRFVGGGAFSDTDCIRYGEITKAEDIVWDQKSQYSFKEALLPAVQTLFYFTENSVKEPEPPQKDVVIFLRSCDLHALRRLDAMYLKNGPEDAYYRRLRDGARFVLMGCDHSFENCFCVSMGTNRSDNYALSIDRTDDGFLLDCKAEDWQQVLKALGAAEVEVTPAFVTENAVAVSIPEDLSIEVAKSRMWNEYDSRCIACGRCNFVCPTCTCFTMQDMFYSETGRVGERRRVWASCMVDGFTDVAGGGSYRKQNGQRMRFKVLHKVLDYKQRNGCHMCVGCGRCDDVCPEYISFSNCINKLSDAMQEVNP